MKAKTPGNISWLISMAAVLLVILSLNTLYAQSGRPKVLVLPPESSMDSKVVEDFQWELVKKLDDTGNFDVVEKDDYKEYLKKVNMIRETFIPKDMVPAMMDSLKAVIYTWGTLEQPGGGGTEVKAKIDFFFPGNDFSIEGQEFSADNENKLGDLAKNATQVLVKAAERITNMSIARDYYNSQNYTKAIEYYNKLLDAQPNSKDYLYMIATCYLRMEDLDNALVFYNKILDEVDPNHVPTHEILAKNYFSTDKYEEALKHFSKLTEIDPANYDYLMYKVYSLTKLSRDDEALEGYEKLITIKDEDAAIRNQIGYIYYNKANALDEKADAEKVKTLSENAIRHLKRAVELYEAQAQSAESEQTPENIKRVNDCCNLLALSQMKAGDNAGAFETFKAIEKTDPGFANLYYYLAKLSSDMNKINDAIGYYDKAVETMPASSHFSIYLTMGSLYRKVENFNGAINALTKALAQKSDADKTTTALFLRGVSYYDQAQQLDYSYMDDPDMNKLIERREMTMEKANSALTYYTNASTDLAKVTAGRYAKSAQQHLANIDQLRARVDKIKTQIQYVIKTQ